MERQLKADLRKQMQETLVKNEESRRKVEAYLDRQLRQP